MKQIFQTSSVTNPSNFLLKELRNLNKVHPTGYSYLNFPDAAFCTRGSSVKGKKENIEYY